MNHTHLATSAAALVVALNVISGLACSQTYCPYGVYPFSGATSVSASTDVTFYASGELPRDLPELTSAFSFVNDNNEEAVPFTVAIDTTGSSFTLTPDEPLQEGATYRVTGVQARAYQGGGTWWSPNDDQTTTVFSVGDGPAQPLSVAYDAEFMEVIVGFSQPVEPTDWNVSVTLPAKPDEAEEDATLARLEPVGSWNSDEGLQRFVLTDGDPELFFAEQQLVTITPDGESPEEPFEGWLDPEQLPEERLSALLSLPHCDWW